MPERISSIEKVVGKGISEKEKGLAIQHFKEKFDNQEFEKLRGLEREKTAEELEIISFVNNKTNELLEKFGLKKFDIPATNIHVIPEDKWKEKGRDAFFDLKVQAVDLRETDSKLVFAKRNFHEMLHFKSGGTLLLKKPKEKFVRRYRFGLVMPRKRGEKKYFSNLNEATTEELVKRLMSSLKNNPLFRDEINETQKWAEKCPQLITEDTFALKAHRQMPWAKDNGKDGIFHTTKKGKFLILL